MTDKTLLKSGKREAKQSYWKQLIQNWRDSGLTQVQFCKENQLKKPTFMYWKSKFDQKEDAPTTLLPVSILPDRVSLSPQSSSGVSLSIGNRFTIHLESRFDTGTLSDLIELLETR